LLVLGLSHAQTILGLIAIFVDGIHSSNPPRTLRP
jgi:hypothetical protein